jgi:hypothetical protein
MCLGLFLNVSGEDRPFEVATYQPFGEFSDLALVSGRLATRNGCLTIESIDGITIPMVPSSSIEVLGPDEIGLFGVKYTLHDEVSLGGGYHPIRTGELPQACDALRIQYGIKMVYQVSQFN